MDRRAALRDRGRPPFLLFCEGIMAEKIMQRDDMAHMLNVLRRGGREAIPDEVMEEYWLDNSTRDSIDPIGPDNCRRIIAQAELRYKKKFFVRPRKITSSVQEGVKPAVDDGETESESDRKVLEQGTRVLVRERDPSSGDERWTEAIVKFHKPKTKRYACNLEGVQQGYKEYAYEDVQEAVLQEA